MSATQTAPGLPAKTHIRRTIEVECTADVDIEDFDDDVVLERARELGGTKFVAAEDAIDLAQRAYLAIVGRDPATERSIARELIGTLIGRIL